MKGCPLCGFREIYEFYWDKARSYFQCQRCGLIFVPSEFHLSAEAEKAEYDLHRNSPNDIGYRKFLSRIFNPMNERLSPESRGLDFGSGPGPTLSVMFEEAGHEMAVFDKYYAPDADVFDKRYDFVTATEVVEHLCEPKIELDRIWNLISPGGWLGIMTKLVLDVEAFSSWHYKNDSTHICYFSKNSFKWLACDLNAELIFADKDVILFHKTESVANC